MAVYKVPQDVEADDKLIGPFSFRQFIYLIIVALSIAAAWGLAQLFIGLAVIPVPVILLFGALALPLRKDQPMEIYLAAIVSFYLKPHKRLWDPEGIESLIEITAPKAIEPVLTKSITQADAEQRFAYLANLVDSGGWAIRGVAGQPDSPLNSDAYLEAQSAEDVLDTSNSVGQTFDTMMERRTEQLKEEARQHMFNPAPATAPTPTVIAPNPATTVQQPVVQAAYQAPDPTVTFNPYPTDIQQTVIQPINDPSHQYQPEPAPAPTVTTEQPATTSDKPVSPDIISLANNSDLSIETIAHEAHRIQKKKDVAEEEVVISLR